MPLPQSGITDNKEALEKPQKKYFSGIVFLCFNASKKVFFSKWPSLLMAGPLKKELFSGFPYKTIIFINFYVLYYRSFS